MHLKTKYSNLKSANSRRSLKNFFPVPRQKLRLRQLVIILRQDQTGPLVGEHPRCRLIAAVEMLAEDDLEGIRQGGECPEVEHFMVH